MRVCPKRILQKFLNYLWEQYRQGFLGPGRNYESLLLKNRRLLIMDDKSFDEFIKGKALEENILIPSLLNQKITSTFKALPKRKKYHSRLFRIGSVAAILAFCILTSIGFASPSFAANVKNVSNTISSNISNLLGLQKDLDEYKTVIDKVDLNGDLDIKILCSEIKLMSSNDAIKGSWDFEFRTNGNQLKTDTRVLLLNHKFTLENGGEYTLTKYTDNSLGQEIYASISNSKRNPTYVVSLRGIDDLGNKVEFYMSFGGKEEALFKVENIDGNLNENATTLTLTPYAAILPDKSGEMNGDYKKVGDQFKIDLSLLK